MLKRFKHDLHFPDKCIIFVIAKREPLEGSRFFGSLMREKLGFLNLFFGGSQFFLRASEEKAESYEEKQIVFCDEETSSQCFVILNFHKFS